MRRDGGGRQAGEEDFVRRRLGRKADDGEQATVVDQAERVEGGELIGRRQTEERLVPHEGIEQGARFEQRRGMDDRYVSHTEKSLRLGGPPRSDTTLARRPALAASAMTPARP